MAKPIVVIMFGGQSTEHEISCRSARFLFSNIDTDKFDVAAIAVDRKGRMLAQNFDAIRQDQNAIVHITPETTADDLSVACKERILSFGSGQSGNRLNDRELIVFSIMHGTYGEDGCWQGLFELSKVAYVGPSVKASAIAMDKVIAKQLVEIQGVPVVPYLSFSSEEWQKNRKLWLAKAKEKFGDAVFVKPANLGSSVGVSKVDAYENLETAIEEAFRFDTKVLLEKSMRVREIEFAALGDEEVSISGPGEVRADVAFYSYESKYSDQSEAEVLIPAPVPAPILEKGQEICRSVFRALDLHGLSRIDLFYDEADQKLYFNEANTLPGFTNISQYPLLWKQEGIDSSELITRLCDLALKRFLKDKSLTRSIVE